MGKNIVYFLIVVVFAFLVIAGKFAHIQIYQAKDLQKDVVEQRVRKVEEKPERGFIKDRKGDVLAMSVNLKDIAVYPNMIKSSKVKNEIVEILSENLDISKEEILSKLEGLDKDGNPLKWARIKRKVDVDTAYKIRESKVSGYIEISDSPSRYYLNDKIASNILGFVNDEGLPGAGLELSMNKYLSGVSGFTITEFDHMGNPIPIGIETVSKPIPGQNVKLTIDSYIQYILEKVIEEAAEEMEAEEIHTIVMDPNTGEILGMASYPSFDPNDYQSYDERTYNNHAASYVYEPGSTFKAMYMAMALEAGVINADTNFYDGAGRIRVNGFDLKNWDSVGLGHMTLRDIIVESSNVGMVMISQQLSEEQIVDGLTKFGFSDRTGIELPNEEPGLFPDVEKLRTDPLVKATESYGHGVAVTPLQIIKSFSQIVNGGYEVHPTLIKEVTDFNGNVVYEKEEQERVRVWSKGTIDLMKSYLGDTWVNSMGEARIEGYDGGGKTGTTSKLKDGVYTSEVVGSFVGYVPADDPKYVMLAVVDGPKGYEYRFGNTTAGPVFTRAMSEILSYEGVKGIEEKLEVEGEIQTQEKEYHIKNYKLSFVEDVVDELEELYGNDIILSIDGEGPIVIDQKYNFRRGRLEITLKTSEISNEGKFYIPKLEGLEKQVVAQLFDNQGIEIEFLGEGSVFYQEVSPNEYDKRITKIKLWLD